MVWCAAVAHWRDQEGQRRRQQHEGHHLSADVSVVLTDDARAFVLES